jgi:hypothetical protein
VHQSSSTRRIISTHTTYSPSLSRASLSLSLSGPQRLSLYRAPGPFYFSYRVLQLGTWTSTYLEHEHKYKYIQLYFTRE